MGDAISAAVCLRSACVVDLGPTESTAILPRDFMNSSFPETRSLRRGCNQPGFSLRSACGCCSES
jgi:hypothetical protein